MGIYKSKEFLKPWLILCEGKADKHIILQLLSHLKLEERFTVHYGEDRIGSGNGGFGNCLIQLQETSASFRENVKVVLLVSDTDQDVNESFELIRTCLEKTKIFPAPKAPQTVAKSKSTIVPNIVVLMIPINAPGNLETLCVSAAYGKWPEIEGPLDEYVKGTLAKDWNIGKQSKMRMQSIIAATCESNPDTTLANLCDRKPQFHIPVSHGSFKEISDFLSGFEAFLEAQ